MKVKNFFRWAIAFLIGAIAFHLMVDDSSHIIALGIIFIPLAMLISLNQQRWAVALVIFWEALVAIFGAPGIETIDIFWRATVILTVLSIFTIEFPTKKESG